MSHHRATMSISYRAGIRGGLRARRSRETKKTPVVLRPSAADLSTSPARCFCAAVVVRQLASFQATLQRYGAHDDGALGRFSAVAPDEVSCFGLRSPLPWLSRPANTTSRASVTLTACWEPNMSRLLSLTPRNEGVFFVRTLLGIVPSLKCKPEDGDSKYTLCWKTYSSSSSSSKGLNGKSLLPGATHLPSCT